MRSALRARFKFTERLGFRLAFLLSVALLPLGMIALMQTWRMAHDAEQATEAALYQRTSDVAAGERAIIHSALGAAEALAQTVLENVDDPRACSGVLKDYVARSPVYSFAGFVPTNGIMRCSSASQVVDMRSSPTLRSFMDNPGAQVTASTRGMVSQEPVLIVSQPVTRAGVLLGMLSMSIPHRTLSALRSGMQDQKNVAITLLNARGDVLFSENRPLAMASEALPQSMPTAAVVAEGNRILRAEDGAGNPRIFNVLTVVPGLVYVVGSWQPDAVHIGSDLLSPTALLFPLTMWLTSLVVAYAAVDRLVIRHVQRMRGQMRRFALGKRDAPPEILSDAPSEIAEVSHTFHNLARIIMRDEADREATLQEKTVLLKEIHHRVKNNLQLIASIMNMQIRQVHEPGTRRVLRSVQDRVASLATIHRNLYQADSLSSVFADQLLGDIVRQMTSLSASPGSNIHVSTQFDPVKLYPDQAVPVALLATEAVTNAFKYATRPDDGENRWIRVALLAEGRTARLTVENSRGSGPDAEAEEKMIDGTGLGTQLIRAFAGQLGTEATLEELPGRFRLSASFEVADFEAPDQLPVLRS